MSTSTYSSPPFKSMSTLTPHCVPSPYTCTVTSRSSILPSAPGTTYTVVALTGDGGGEGYDDDELPSATAGAVA